MLQPFVPFKEGTCLTNSQIYAIRQAGGLGDKKASDYKPKPVSLANRRHQATSQADWILEELNVTFVQSYQVNKDC